VPQIMQPDALINASQHETEQADFQLTRQTMERLDDWVMALASPFLPLAEVPQELRGLKGFRWDFREKTERALIVGKAVRMASGIRAALLLADLGYITDCGTILRMVSDFVTEVIAIYEGSTRNEPTRAQKDFVEQYFGPTAQTPDEYDENQEKDRWVARDKLIAAHVRCASEGKQDPDRARKALRFLAHLFDKFVHGSRLSTMELYNGFTHRFMMKGHEFYRSRRDYKRSVASKLHQVLTALFCSACLMQMPALADEIRKAAKELYDSGELNPQPDEGIISY
jgi:hypothetical protein